MSPTRALQQCKKCYATAINGTRFCARHQTADRDSEQQREKTRQNDGLRKFYWSSRWKAVRRFVLGRDPICAHVENGTRCWRLASDCHHIVEAAAWMAQGGDFFDPDNLQGLCHAHHSRHTAREDGFAQTKGSE